MTCICKLKVDRLREALEHLQNNVAGLPSLIPDLSLLENLAANVAENPIAAMPVTSLTPTATPVANLSESEAATVAAAASLSARANRSRSASASNRFASALCGTHVSAHRKYGF